MSRRLDGRRLGDRLDHAVHDDRGVAEVVQVMFLAVPALLFVLLLTLAGRNAEAHNRVEHSAESAAQAAALQRNPAAATQAATVVARAALTNCAGPATVNVDTSSWAPGGIVAVEIRCRIATSDLAPLLPGSYTVTARSAAVIDSRRDFSDGFSNAEGSSAGNPSGVGG